MGGPADILAVAAPARDDVEVQVEDVLLSLRTGAVDDLHVADAKLLAVQPGQLADGRHDRQQIGFGHVEDVLVVGFGDHQGVVFGGGVDI